MGSAFVIVGPRGRCPPHMSSWNVPDGVPSIADVEHPFSPAPELSQIAGSRAR